MDLASSNLPTVIFALQEDTRSALIISALREEEKPPDIRLLVLPNREAVYTEEIKPDRAVVIFDGGMVRNCFSPICSKVHRDAYLFPKWAGDILWGVIVNRNIPPSRIPSAARQIKADFVRHFTQRTGQGRLPYVTACSNQPKLMGRQLMPKIGPYIRTDHNVWPH